MAMNPLLDKTLEVLRQCKRFRKIAPHKVNDKTWELIYSFDEGPDITESFECDRNTFMEWWKDMTTYLRLFWDRLTEADDRLTSGSR